MNQDQIKEQEEKVSEFIKNTIPVFNYSKMKVKKLKKYDGQQLSEELMDELRECLIAAVEYQTITKTKEA